MPWEPSGGAVPRRTEWQAENAPEPPACEVCGQRQASTVFQCPGCVALSSEIVHLGSCRVYWGSHGCNLDREDGHDVHVCGDSDDVCSEYDPKQGVRYMLFDVESVGTIGETVATPAGWSEWYADAVPYGEDVLWPCS